MPIQRLKMHKRTFQLEGIMYDGTNADEITMYLGDKLRTAVSLYTGQLLVFNIKNGPRMPMRELRVMPGDWVIKSKLNGIWHFTALEFTENKMTILNDIS